MRNVWKRLAALCLTALMLFSLTAVAEDDLLARIKERGSIVIAMEGNWEPWTYHNENDELVGLDVEIGKLIAEGLGVKAEFVETDWNSIFGGIDSGRFDIACNGVGITAQRQEKYTFSTSIPARCWWCATTMTPSTPSTTWRASAPPTPLPPPTRPSRSSTARS